MKFAGIIAEYDPFHNGHAWQLAQARALGAQRVAVAMSCGLTQRGALPLLPEAVRVQAALACGADLVFALPAPCACAGAEAFARAGVRILAAAGCDALVFGAETPDTALLQKAARVLCSEAYRTALKQQLAAGARSFAAARQARATTLQAADLPQSRQLRILEEALAQGEDWFQRLTDLCAQCRAVLDAARQTLRLAERVEQFRTPSTLALLQDAADLTVQQQQKLDQNLTALLTGMEERQTQLEQTLDDLLAQDLFPSPVEEAFPD